MDGPTGGWGSPSALADTTASAPWGALADLEGFSWFASPSEADAAPLLQPMPPLGGPLPPPLPPPLAADPLFDHLLAQPLDAAQQQWVPPIVQPQFQQMDLPQPAPQPPAGGGTHAGASAAEAEEARRARNRAGEQTRCCAYLSLAAAGSDTCACLVVCLISLASCPTHAAAQARFREKQKASALAGCCWAPPQHFARILSCTHDQWHAVTNCAQQLL